jgi:hypothetical protein
MKDFFVLLAIGMILVLGIGWFLLPGRALDMFARSMITVQSDSADVPPDDPVPVPEQPRKVRPAPAAPPVTDFNEPPPSTLRERPAPPKTAPANFDFPVPGDVTTGQERQQIVDEYGAPALSAFTQDHGHLFETYIYRRDRSVAVINLQDGRVSSVSIGESNPLRPR